MISGADENLRDKFKKAVYQSRLDRQSRLEINTGLNFLLNVSGWRRGSVSIILGTTSSGKSTIVRTIISDILAKNSKTKISCFLSEETSGEYSLELFKAFNNTSFEKRIDFYSEQECIDENESASLLSKAFEDGNEILIYDNITTSDLYNTKTPQEQSKFSNNLKRAANKTNKALICVAHTNNVDKIAGKLVNSSDIRGSKNLPNIAEFFFINHQISASENLYNYIQIEKHRGQSPANKFFMMMFDRKRNIFSSDLAVKFDKFKEMHKTRDKI